MADYKGMTNPEIVASIATLEGDEREKALASLEGRREGIEEALNAQLPVDGARQATLERLGREKQINDSQAWTADGVSPNSALVTEAAKAKFTEAEDGEKVIEDLTKQTAEKAEASGDIVAGHDTSATLSSEDAAGVGEESAGDTGKTLKGKLPADFPAKAELEAAGVTTYARARALRDGDGFTSVAGIGTAKEAQIIEALKE